MNEDHEDTSKSLTYITRASPIKTDGAVLEQNFNLNTSEWNPHR